MKFRSDIDRQQDVSGGNRRSLASGARVQLNTAPRSATFRSLQRAIAPLANGREIELRTLKRRKRRAPGAVSFRKIAAFTLVELLVVMGVIALLVGLILPVLARIKLNAKINSAREVMRNVETAVADYRARYTWQPGASIPGQDVTYGLVVNGRGIASNADLMTVLMDLDTGINRNHVKNPHHQVTLFAPRCADTSSPGLSSVDNELRDPWGHSYVITIDGNSDDYCDDALYSVIGAQRERGLVDPANNGKGPFLYRGSIMIWSLGPDGKADASTNSAGSIKNKDNILGWQ
jgi:type II secretory pathway pseudopilin PulG